jgi:hypothetical protein
LKRGDHLVQFLNSIGGVVSMRADSVLINSWASQVSCLQGSGW